MACAIRICSVRHDASAKSLLIAELAHLEETMNGTVYNYRVEGAKYGISFGTALAIAISYVNNQSILWAIIHGFLSWLYVIYFVLFK
jgi:hypothetical protein